MAKARDPNQGSLCEQPRLTRVAPEEGLIDPRWKYLRSWWEVQDGLRVRVPFIDDPHQGALRFREGTLKRRGNQVEILLDTNAVVSVETLKSFQVRRPELGTRRLG